MTHRYGSVAALLADALGEPLRPRMQKPPVWVSAHTSSFDVMVLVMVLSHLTVMPDPKEDPGVLLREVVLRGERTGQAVLHSFGIVPRSARRRHGAILPDRLAGELPIEAILATHGLKTVGEVDEISRGQAWDLAEALGIERVTPVGW